MNFLKHGKGVQYFPNGDIFQGIFVEGRPHGYGRYQWKNGMIYEGLFKDGYREGKGKIQKEDMFY